MSKIKDFLKSPLGTALCAAAACLLAVVLVWLAAVRPNNDKSLSQRRAGRSQRRCPDL